MKEQITETCIGDLSHFKSKKKPKYLGIALCSLGLSISSFAFSQQISVSLQNEKLEKIISTISQQSGLKVAYSKEVIKADRKLDFEVNDADLTQALNLLAERANINYEVKNNKIFFTSKPRISTKNSHAPTEKIEVKGTVVDEQGEPVIGANVMVEGTSLGTITDLDGLFELSIPGNSRLKISYLGYTDQQINVDGKSKFNIVLREATKALDEVIVVGYGSTSVKKIVSAVTALKGESLQNLPSTTITGSLQGRATGVIVQNQGGEPGSVPKISIRGGGDPIYVIDGVVSDPWNFNMINPVDIESVSVLKDAASLAVYGSRAADGIILVKTKEGRKGRTSIVYSFTAQYSQPTHLPEKIDSYTYASLQNSAASNDGYPDYHVYSEEVMDIIRNQSDPYRYANTDWLSLGLKKFAPEYRHSLSMTGNSKDINYYLSLGIMDQGSLYTSDALNYNRYTLRSNVNTKFDEIGLTVAVNINGAVEQKHYPSFSAGSIWDHLFSRTPLMPAFNPDGTYTTSTDHPLVEMDKRSGYTKNDGKFINTQFVADWDLPWVTGLRLGTMFNYRLNDGHDKSLYATAPQYNADGSLYQATKPSMKESAAFGDSYNFEVNANWSKTFNDKHNFEAKGVFTVSESNGSNFWASRKEYLSTVVDQLFAGSPVGQLNSGNAYEGGRMGVVGRLKYDYANRYYVEGSFRYDGSDNFAPGYRWGLFPSIALAWDITEEPFFKRINNNGLITLLKLRGSYGKTGTENGVNRFGYLSVYNMNENVITIGGNLQPGFSEGNLVSPELLSWYTRNSLNFGLDFAMLDNKLRLTADYFFYVTKGGLMSPGDRYTTPLGKPLPQIKSDSEHRREGVEFSTRWNSTINNDFRYDVGFNMTYFNNLWVKKADEALTSLMNPLKRQTHQTDYYGIGYIDNGFYQNPWQVINSPRRPQSSETKLGDIMYQDVNGDGKLDGEDQVRLGMPTMPHFTYGFDFNLSYKGFTLSGLFYGTGKRFLEFGTHYKKGEAAYILDQAQLDYWREDNPNAQFPRISQQSSVNGNNNTVSSSFWMTNAAFIRLKDLQLAYDLKHALLSRATWIQTCRVNLTGSNLFTISSVGKYFDPEAASTAGGYPIPRTYSIGVTVGF